MTSDHVEIERLLLRYCATLDRGQFDECADLFEHAEFTVEGFPRLNGSAEVREMFANLKRYEQGRPRTRHVLTNVQIEVDVLRALGGHLFL